MFFVSRVGESADRKWKIRGRKCPEAGPSRQGDLPEWCDIAATSTYILPAATRGCPYQVFHLNPGFFPYSFLVPFLFLFAKSVCDQFIFYYFSSVLHFYEKGETFTSQK